MIYELVKRDQAWKVMHWFVLAAAVVCACPPSPVSAPVGFGVVMGLFFAAAPPLRATRLYAALPIAGRDLVLARIFAMMAMIWLPTLAGAAAAAVFSRPSPVVVGLLVTAAMCTLAAGVAQSIRVRELAGPKWMLLPLFLLTLEAGLFLVQFRATALIPSSCALVGIALLARTWSVAPKSFELAPAEPRHGDSLARVQGDPRGPGGPPHLLGPARPPLQTGVASPRLVWLPVLRSVFTVPYLTLLALLVFFGFGGQRLALCVWILVPWMITRQTTLWLRPLPIRPRALLITMTAPIQLALAGGYFAALYPGPIPALPVQVLDLGALLAFGLAVVLAIELVDWRRLSHIPVKVRHTTGAVLLLVSFGVGMYWHDADPLHIAALRLAQALPNSVALAIALVAAVLGALWWALEKIFAEADHAAKPPAPRQECFAG